MKPRLLDLFCGAGALNWSNDNSDVPALRRGVRVPAQDAEVLLAGLFQSSRLGGHEDAPMPTLRQGVPGVRDRRRQSSALFQGMCQEPRGQDGEHLAGRAPRDADDLPQESTNQGPWLRAETVAGPQGKDSRPTGRRMRRVWGNEPLLAARRLHPYGTGSDVPTPQALPIRVGASG